MTTQFLYLKQWKSNLCGHPTPTPGILWRVILVFISLVSTIWSSPKPVDLKFRGHMCADVPYTVTLNGLTVGGEGQSCGAFKDSDWGTAKLVPDQVYTVSTGGALCSCHIQFEKKCYRLFVKGAPYNDWTERDEIDKEQTQTNGMKNKDAGGTWQIKLTLKDQSRFGIGANQLGSVAVSISLGGLPSGIPAGKLLLTAESIGPTTYTPAALQCSVYSADVEVLRSGANLRQIYTWDGLVDVVSTTGGFETRFYSLADVGAKGTNGFYSINAGAVPIVVWSILNPDPNATNRLRVSEQRPGTTTAFNTYSQISGFWNLESGTGSQVRNASSKSQTTIGGEPVEVVTETQYSSPTVFETTTTRTYTSLASAQLAEKIQSIEYPDGRTETSIYENGFYDVASHTFTAGAGTYVRTLTTHGMVTAPGLLADKSTRDVVVADAQSLPVLEELYVYVSGAFARVTQTWHIYDIDGHLTASARDGQPIYNAVWGYGSKSSETDESGNETTIYYDNDNNFYFLKVGIGAEGSYPAQPGIVREGSRGSYSSETVTAGGLTTYSSRGSYNGQLNYEIQNDLQTDYYYSTSNSGGSITTITRPGGETEIREQYTDGKLKSVTGTSVNAEYYTYGSDTADNEWTKINYGSATSANYLKTTTNWLGRIIREERPAYDGLFVKQCLYNAKGQLWKETTTGLADRLYEFDALGNQVRSGQDMNGNGTLDLASTDRIEGTDFAYEQEGSTWYRTTRSTNYITDNASTPTYSYEKERLNLPLNTLSEIRTFDAGSNETVRITTVNRTAKLATETVSVPGSTTSAITVTRNGLLQSASTNSVSAPTTFINDALGRQIGVIDPRTGTQTSITYDDGPYASNRVATVVVGDQTVVQTYYSAQEIWPGLLKSRSVNGKRTYFEYDSRGQIVHTWGEASYPTWNEYDAFGRLWKLHTYRAEAGWNATTWPSSAGAGDVTTWNYQDSTGLLLSKTDAASKSVSYTYKPFGEVDTRTWARGVSATYSYTSFGDVQGIDYSDTTPDVTFTPDRTGNRKTIVDAAGIHTLTYSALGQLKADSVGGSGILANVSVAVGYDSLFHKATVDATLDGSTLFPQQTTHYDPATGRVQDLGDGAVSGVYTYKPNSDWLNSTTLKRGTTTVMTATREPDSLNRLLSVTNSVNGQPSSSSSFTYRYSSRGLRDKVTLADNSYWSFGYDDRAQVTSGQHFWTDAAGVAGMQYGYTFDTIGNRTNTNTNARPATYVPDTLNRYTSRTVPAAVDVLGNAASDATVTVNNETTARKATYFSKTLTVDNSTAAAFPVVSVVGVKNNVGPGGEDAVTNVTGNVFVPKTPETFGYDDDGNLTSDGRWTYTWDGENRLSSVTSLTSAPAASKLKLLFDYDADGRRIRKTVQKWSTVTNSYQQTSQLRFVYDGWNLVAEINAANAPVRTYLWGLDLSGTFEQAGGVGGLLSITDSQAPLAPRYFAFYDGNGNIVSLIDSATGLLAASYLYGPFGELLSKNGPFAGDNPFGFSSKYLDAETGLCNFPYRFYGSQTGRWLSRDPIGENGGESLYAYCANNPIDTIDPLGRDFITVGSNQAIPPLTSAIGGHLSIHLWNETQLCIQEKDAKSTDGSNQQDWSRSANGGPSRLRAYVPNDASFEEVMELDFKEDFETTYSFTPIFGQTRIKHDRVPISRPTKNDTDNADLFVVIYADTATKKDTRKQWARILYFAKNYRYAEHGDSFPLGYRARNWPNSKYGKFYNGTSNNSNTFTRYLARSIKRSADVFPGRQHPGNTYPIPVNDRRPTPIYVGL